MTSICAISSHTRPKLRRIDLENQKISVNTDILQHVKDIETCQKDIDIFDDKEKSEKYAIVVKYASYFKTLFESRSKIINSLPNFWASVMEYHPMLTSIVNDQVVDVLRHATKVEMEYTGLNRYKFSVHFGSNPYIENEVICKEVCEEPKHHYVSQSTDILWKNNPFRERRPRGTERKRKNEEYTFFDWFCNKACTKDDFDLMLNLDIVWQNPFPIFFMVTGTAVGDEEILALEIEKGTTSEEEDDEESDVEENAGDDSDEDDYNDCVSRESLGTGEEEDLTDDDDVMDCT